MKNIERLSGFVLLLLMLVLGATLLDSSMLLFKLLIGAGFGYALTRSRFGFAGSVNRAYTAGSGKLMRYMMWMFVATAILAASLLYNLEDPTIYRLRIYPISAGAILGGLMFGFGMALSSCCASGALGRTITTSPRGIITVFFFGMGVFIAFPVKSMAWVKESWFSTEIGLKDKGGVFFPDLFKWDGLDGYLGAVLLTALLAGIVAYLAKKYEEKQIANGTFSGVSSEIEQEKQYPTDNKQFKLLSEETYDKLFVRTWSLRTGAAALSILYLILMSVTKAGWGITTSLGYWFGKLLIIFGATPDGLAEYSGRKASAFSTPFFEHGGSVLNFGLILGVILALLLAGKLVERGQPGLKFDAKDLLLFSMGGLIMGIGTRFANGCNVGALYSPIATFSLSGWVFLATMVGGGILGNKFSQRVKPTCAV